MANCPTARWRIGPIDGTLYGTTINGGTVNGGTVFQLARPASPGQPWTETILHSFTGVIPGPDGAFPNGGLTFGKDGTLYGTTIIGGPGASDGTVFQLTPPPTPGGDWSESVLYTFMGGTDGAEPFGELVVSEGQLYGITGDGGGTGCGGLGCGTVFQLMPPVLAGGAWTETTLYRFLGGNDGGDPGCVLMGSDGLLYGTTRNGGGDGCYGNGCGTVFSLSPPTQAGGVWTETVLHSFTGGADGGYPYTLLLGKHGVLYGMNFGNDLTPPGTLFSLTPPLAAGENWTLETLYTFQGGTDGDGPWGLVPVGNDGVLAGVTVAGGFSNYGTIFELTPGAEPGGAWTERILYRFQGGSGGDEPVWGLTVGKSGALYGITYAGGDFAGQCDDTNGCGGVFELEF